MYCILKPNQYCVLTLTVLCPNLAFHKTLARCNCALPGEAVSTQSLILQDRFPQDMEGAVAAVRSRGDTATADLWQEALDNLTMGTPGASPPTLAQVVMLSHNCAGIESMPAYKVACLVLCPLQCACKAGIVCFNLHSLRACLCKVQALPTLATVPRPIPWAI